MSIESIAQKGDYSLVLRKVPRGKRVVYEISDPILFKYNDSIFLDTILQIDSNQFQLKSSEQYNINEVQAVYDIQGRSFFRNGAVKFPVAGAIFFSLTTINQGLSHGKPIVLREHLIPSLGLMAVGALMIPFRYKHYQLNRRWELICIPS